MFTSSHLYKDQYSGRNNYKSFPMKLSNVQLHWINELEKVTAISEEEMSYAKDVLETAVMINDWCVVANLINKGIDFEQPNKYGETLLHLASAAGAFVIITKMFAKKSNLNVNVANNNGKTALDLAIAKNQWKTAEFLINKGANVSHDVSSSHALLRAAKANEWNLVKQLIEKQVVVDLEVSLYVGQSGKESLLTYLIREQDWKHLSWLLVPEVKLKDKWYIRSLVRHIARDGDLDFLKLMIQKLDENINTPFYHDIMIDAANEGKFEVAKWFLEKGLDVNYQNQHNFTLLSLAIAQSKLEIVKELIERGADVPKSLNYRIAKKYSNNPEINIILNNAMTVFTLKVECSSYQNYLQKIIDSGKDRQSVQANKKLRKLKILIESLSSEKEHVKNIDQFKENLKKEEIADLIENIPDARDKKFKRIVFGILSGGIYAIVRGIKLGSASFWKSRREVFAEKVNPKNLTI